MSTISLSAGICSNYKSYTARDAVLCAMIDVIAFASGIGLISLMLVATSLVLAATSYGVEYTKNYFFRKKE